MLIVPVTTDAGSGPTGPQLRKAQPPAGSAFAAVLKDLRGLTDTGTASESPPDEEVLSHEDGNPSSTSGDPSTAGPSGKPATDPDARTETDTTGPPDLHPVDPVLTVTDHIPKAQTARSQDFGATEGQRAGRPNLHSGTPDSLLPDPASLVRSETTPVPVDGGPIGGRARQVMPTWATTALSRPTDIPRHGLGEPMAVAPGGTPSGFAKMDDVLPFGHRTRDAAQVPPVATGGSAGTTAGAGSENTSDAVVTAKAPDHLGRTADKGAAGLTEPTQDRRFGRPPDRGATFPALGQVAETPLRHAVGDTTSPEGSADRGSLAARTVSDPSEYSAARNTRPGRDPASRYAAPAGWMTAPASPPAGPVSGHTPVLGRSAPSDPRLQGPTEGDLSRARLDTGASPTQGSALPDGLVFSRNVARAHKAVQTAAPPLAGSGARDPAASGGLFRTGQTAGDLPFEAGLPALSGPGTPSAPATGNTTMAPSAQAAGVAQQLATAAQAATRNTVEVSLNPAELGRVRMSITAQDQAVTLVIHVDRPETADLMRRHAETLATEFRQMGYSNLTLDISSGGERSTGQQGKGTAQDPGPARPAPAAPQTDRPHPTSNAVGSSDGIDLKV